MVELRTVYNNAHKFLREGLANDFKNYSAKHNISAFEYVQALVFSSLAQKEPNKNKETFMQLVDAYNKDADFKALVNKAFNHLKEQYKGELLQFPDGQKVDLERFVSFTQKQLDAGKIDYEGRLKYLTKELKEEELM